MYDKYRKNTKKGTELIREGKMNGTSKFYK